MGNAPLRAPREQEHAQESAVVMELFCQLDEMLQAEQAGGGGLVSHQHRCNKPPGTRRWQCGRPGVCDACVPERRIECMA